MSEPLAPEVISKAFSRAVEAASTAQRKNGALLDDVVAAGIHTFVGWLRCQPDGQAWLLDQGLKPALERLAQGLPPEEPAAPKAAKPRWTKGKNGVASHAR